MECKVAEKRLKKMDKITQYTCILNEPILWLKTSKSWHSEQMKRFYLDDCNTIMGIDSIKLTNSNTGHRTR